MSGWKQTGRSRRDVVRLGTALAGATAWRVIMPGSASAELAPGPVIETAEGLLRGVTDGRLNVFKGVHYGESTAGRNRFRPPVPVKPWTGLRDAVAFADPCFQNNPDWQGWKEDRNGSEDCLALNVWAPIGGAGRPVMVFLHGGAYFYGSGGAPIYDAGRLAERGDVVAVTVNHRLHMLGFMHLADVSADFRGSSNAGLLDLVEALRWVRRNIAAFGGDPGNVTVFGESGGGCKVSCLLSMPAAAGLFQKAIIESGSQRRVRTPEQATADAEQAFRVLGVGLGDVTALQAVPPQAVWDAYVKIAGTKVDCLSGVSFTPVLDPATLPHQPGSPETAASSLGVRLLVGTNEAEGTFPLVVQDLLKRPADGTALFEALRKVFGKLRADDKARVDELLRLQALTRQADLLDQIVTISTDLWMGQDAIDLAETRLASGCAPVFMYRFGWREPCFGGSWATHAAELPFVFDKLDVNHIWGDDDVLAQRQRSDPDGRRYQLRDAVIGAWSSFAHSGAPSSPGLPAWPAYSLDTRSTMRLDAVSSVVEDPLGPARRRLLSLLDVGLGS